ncbi:MAG: HEAT repeat domain-containing protein [Cyanobacteriota bacterium]
MIDGLIDQLKDRTLSIDDRYGAILALYRIFGYQSFDVLKSVLDDSNESPEIRSAVALVLGKLGAESLSELKKHLNDKNPIIRNYVVQAIGMIGEVGIPVLFKALKDEDNDVFYSAADAIGSIGNPAVPYLTELLDNGKEDAKCVAAWKLGEIKDLRAVSALISAIRCQDNNDDIKSLSVWALGEISRKSKNNKSIISALYRASRSKNPEVKHRAYIALRKARDYVN